MMHDKAMRRFGAVISSLVCGAAVACAGGDTPSVNDELESAISNNFGNGRAAVAGGAGGRAPAASGGRAGSAAAGSANAPAAGSGGSGAQEPVAAAGASGDPTGSETGAEPPPSGGGACDGFAVLAEHCSGGSCHGAGGIGDFAESEEAALAFVGVSGTVTCGGEGPLLNPDNPRQSIIVQKVNGTVPCGGPMPLGAGPLSDDDISCLEEWIATL